jgi:hypothetical protein
MHFVFEIGVSLTIDNFLLSTEIEVLEKYNLSIVNHHKLLNSNFTYGGIIMALYILTAELAKKIFYQKIDS